MKYNTTRLFKLQESKHLLHQITQCTSDILYVLDLEKMNIVFINEKATSVFGYKNIFLEMIHPADNLARMKHLEACEKLNGDEIKEINIRLKVKDGSWRWFYIRDIAFKRNPLGAVYQVIGFVKDIHEQELARTALELAHEKIKDEYRKSEVHSKLLQCIFDTISGGIFVYKSIRDQQNKIIDFRLDTINHTLESESTHMVQVGRTLLSILSSAEHKDFFERVVNAVEHNEPGEEFMHYHEDGYDNWYDIKYQKFEDGVLIAYTDITEIRKTEDQLKDYKNFIEHITTTTPDIIYIMDLDKKSIVFSNDRAYQILGQSPTHVSAQGLNVFHQFLHPNDIDRRIEHVEACKELKENEIKEIDVRLKVRNGSWHWFRIRDKAFKRMPDGTVLQTIGIAQDIHVQNLITLSLKQQN